MPRPLGEQGVDAQGASTRASGMSMWATHIHAREREAGRTLRALGLVLLAMVFVAAVLGLALRRAPKGGAAPSCEVTR